MIFTCMLCDKPFDTDTYDKPQTTYVFCPACYIKTREETREIVNKASKTKRKTKQKLSPYKVLQKSLQKKGVDVSVRQLKKGFQKKDKQKLAKEIVRKSVDRKQSLKKE